jgi:isocitrate/isopropylmalate dehydrogenase
MLDGAVREAIASGQRTRDLGGELSTTAFTAAVSRRIGAGAPG